MTTIGISVGQNNDTPVVCRMAARWREDNPDIVSVEIETDLVIGGEPLAIERVQIHLHGRVADFRRFAETILAVLPPVEPAAEAPETPKEDK